MVTEFLNSIGTIVSEQNILFDKDILIYMKYDNSQKDIKIEINNTGILTNIGSGYVYDINIDGFETSSSIHNKSLFELLNKNKKNNPKIYTYNNSQNKSNDSFTIRFNNDLIDIEMSFDKDRSIIETRDSIIVCVNNSDGSTNIKDIAEEYQFFKNGFYCKNNKNSTDTIVSNGITANFKLFIKKDKLLNYPMICKLPTMISYSEPFNTNFQLYYNSLGLVSNCIDISNSSQRLCRYEESQSDSNKKYRAFKSIHPLFYDTFDYSNLDKPLKYWTEDIIDCSDEIITINRSIFIVDDKNIESLIKFINNEKRG